MYGHCYEKIAVGHYWDLKGYKCCLSAHVALYVFRRVCSSYTSQNVLFCGQNVVAVIIGGTLGHGLCTGLAVVGGRLIAQKISVRTGKLPFDFLFKIFIFFIYLVFKHITNI